MSYRAAMREHRRPRTRYTFISRLYVDPPVGGRGSTFRSRGRGRYGYTRRLSIEVGSIVMQPAAHRPKLNSCLYTGTKAGPDTNRIKRRYPRNNSRDYPSQIFVSAMPLLDAGRARPMDINAGATSGIMRNHRPSGYPATAVTRLSA